MRSQGFIFKTVQDVPYLFGYLFGYLFSGLLNRDLFSQGYGKAQPHADFHNLQLRQPQFFRLSNNTGDAAAPLFNQIQFTEDTGDDMVADFGNALTHIIDGHARQEDAGVFDFNMVIEKGDADGWLGLGSRNDTV